MYMGRCWTKETAVSASSSGGWKKPSSCSSCIESVRSSVDLRGHLEFQEIPWKLPGIEGFRGYGQSAEPGQVGRTNQELLSAEMAEAEARRRTKVFSSRRQGLRVAPRKRDLWTLSDSSFLSG